MMNCTNDKISKQSQENKLSCEIRIPFEFIFEILEEYGAPPALLGCRCRVAERAIQMSSVLGNLRL